MRDIETMQEVIAAILEQKSHNTCNTLPIFSFEGLPGVGKTTQIKKICNELNTYGKAYYIDLPSDSSIGLVLEAIYSNTIYWDKIRNEAPWINPLLLSVDLKMSIQKAKDEGAKYIVMARGILSTYYFNLNTFINKYNDASVAWKKLEKVLQGFEKPTAIIYLEVPIEEAHKRVIKRKRESLREIDQIDNMKLYRSQISKLIDHFQEGNIPIHYIDASQNEDIVMGNIDSVLSEYLDEVFY